jgi:hypothetical protein
MFVQVPQKSFQNAVDREIFFSCSFTREDSNSYSKSTLCRQYFFFNLERDREKEESSGRVLLMNRGGREDIFFTLRFTDKLGTCGSVSVIFFRFDG